MALEWVKDMVSERQELLREEIRGINRDFDALEQDG